MGKMRDLIANMYKSINRTVDITDIAIWDISQDEDLLEWVSYYVREKKKSIQSID